MTRISVLLCLSSLCYLYGLAQDKDLGSDIDSLRREYSLYPNKYPPLYTDNALDYPPPPPPFGDESMSSLKCIKAYNIPTEKLTAYYPWNADSIVVSTYENGRLGYLSTEQTKELTGILYNTDYKIEDETNLIFRTTSVIGSGMPIPNFSLVFYHKDSSFFADVYEHLDNPMRILDSSYQNPYDESYNAYSISDHLTHIYWGCECDGMHEMLKEFIEKSFKTTLNTGKYEMDYIDEIPILDLIERTPDGN